MTFFMNIVYFVLVLGLLVFIHELGHLLAAKAFGVYCQEFALGMGPKLFSYKRKNAETTYSIRALPIGGFVSMAGEPGEGDMNVPFERSIPGIKPWKRLIIMLAGIFMNFVLAIIIFMGIFFVNGTVDVPPAIVERVAENSPAEKAGILAGDQIVKLEFFNGKTLKVDTFNELTLGVVTYADRELKVTVDRSGEEKTLSMTPQKDGDRYIIGVYPVQGQHRSVNIFESISLAWFEVVSVVSSLIFVLSSLVKGIGTEAVGGPIEIFKITGQVAQGGILFFFVLVASLSVNLAVMNLLPIPVLDGGRALLTIIEMIIRRPIPKKLENAIMSVGLVMMLVIFVLIMYKDIFM